MKAQTVIPIATAHAISSPNVMQLADRAEIAAAGERQRRTFNSTVEVLPSETVPRQRYLHATRSRDMYQRLYIQDRTALAAERADNHRLRKLLVSAGIDPNSANSTPGSAIVLTASQLAEALEFACPDGSDEQLQADVVFTHGDGHAGVSWYAHLADCPEEGAIYLDGSTAKAPAWSGEARPAAALIGLQGVDHA